MVLSLAMRVWVRSGWRHLYSIRLRLFHGLTFVLFDAPKQIYSIKQIGVCGADIPDMVRVKAEEKTRAPITIIVRGNISS